MTPSATNSVAAEGAPSPDTRGRAGGSIPWGGGEAVPPDAETPNVDVLGTKQFKKQLHVEKRRADRVGSPLSLVLITVNAEAGGGLGVVQELIELVNRSKRETDVLGYVAKDKIGVLLPHTDQSGAQAFVNGLIKRTTGFPIGLKFSTYPDQLLDSFDQDARDPSETITFLFDEQTEQGALGAATKRGMDVLGALVGVVIFLPFMVAIGIAVALTSPGPIVFRQTRIGKGGTPFVFYKFRSMRANSDDRIHREYVANLIEGNLDEVNQGDHQQPLYKMTADPRVTAVGRFIRKTSLDELPQFFNVLKGDMSLVGPRPPLPYEAEKYQSWHLRRILQVRPGITGLWQVEGRSTTSFDDMVRLDLRYVRHCSPWLDLKILLKTIAVVLRRNGAS